MSQITTDICRAFEELGCPYQKIKHAASRTSEQSAQARVAGGGPLVIGAKANLRLVEDWPATLHPLRRGKSSYPPRLHPDGALQLAVRTVSGNIAVILVRPRFDGQEYPSYPKINH